jgi:hypothetical protein
MREPLTPSPELKIRSNAHLGYIYCLPNPVRRYEKGRASSQVGCLTPMDARLRVTGGLQRNYSSAYRTVRNCHTAL